MDTRDCDTCLKDDPAKPRARCCEEQPSAVEELRWWLESVSPERPPQTEPCLSPMLWSESINQRLME